jgi:hypothetical protein
MLLDRREIDVGVVDAVEGVGEDGQGNRQGDLGQLRVSVGVEAATVGPKNDLAETKLAQ